MSLVCIETANWSLVRWLTTGPNHVLELWKDNMIRRQSGGITLRSWSVFGSLQCAGRGCSGSELQVPSCRFRVQFLSANHGASHMFLHCDPRAATVSRSAIRQDSLGVELSFQLSPTIKSRQRGTNQTTTLHKLQRLFTCANRTQRQSNHFGPPPQLRD